jgi:hypothetical protein
MRVSEELPDHPRLAEEPVPTGEFATCYESAAEALEVGRSLPGPGVVDDALCRLHKTGELTGRSLKRHDDRLMFKLGLRVGKLTPREW